MARKRRRKIKKPKFKISPKLIWVIIYSLSVIIALGGLGYYMYISDIFKITEVKSNLALGQNLKKEILKETLFTIDIQSIVKAILKNHPEYEKVTVLKRFPSTIMISIKKRLACAQLKAKKFYPIDKEAIVLSEGSSKALDNLILIEISDYNRFFDKGYKIKDERVTESFELIEALQSQGFLKEFEVKLINFTYLSAAYFIICPQSFDLKSEACQEEIKIITGENDFPKKIKVLMNLLEEELKKRISLVKYIDLRHKKVYVGFDR
jgi:hypothetical protein